MKCQLPYGQLRVHATAAASAAASRTSHRCPGVTGADRRVAAVDPHAWRGAVVHAVGIRGALCGAYTTAAAGTRRGLAAAAAPAPSAISPAFTASSTAWPVAKRRAVSFGTCGEAESTEPNRDKEDAGVFHGIMF